ncbi:ribulose-phosphate 3-epimerase [Anaerofustis butyriciformans]|uniref:ribulose-phosphate 3-epimerase n=1 Tax=Anaerofustis butyriciformans TaxID=3108533 RepID=UPI002E37EC51|nr:ribulose-phosphate 3-epimerase [Anaerofustis sp. HA2171]
MDKIAASIMCGNALEYGEELDALKEAGVDMIHFDVMDGEFVNNLGMGLYMLEAMKEYTDMVFDVHLMVVEPDVYYERIAKTGAEYICIHAEAVKHLHRSIMAIKAAGAKAGVVLNPSTNLNVLKEVIKDIDLVCLMTVNPGGSGEKFIPNQYKKIADLKAMKEKYNPDLLIEVDGNIGPETIPGCAKAGADVYVCGTSAIFKGDRNLYKPLTKEMKDIIHKAVGEDK